MYIPVYLWTARNPTSAPVFPPLPCCRVRIFILWFLPLWFRSAEFSEPYPDRPGSRASFTDRDPACRKTTGMRAGMQSLLSVLRGAAGHRAFDDGEWPALLGVAGEENVLPWVAGRLRLGDAALTPQQQGQLAEIQREAQFSAFVWTAALKSLLAAFHQASVPVIALKGPCLGQRLYGDASLRAYADLDLLVRMPDLGRAEDLLAQLGFHPGSLGDDYHRPWQHNAIRLELHHHVENPRAFPFQLEAAWTRAQLSRFEGVPVWHLAPPDELLYLCLHAVHHRFDRLGLLVDLGLAFRRLVPAADAAPSAHFAALDNVAALGWMMAARLDPQTPNPLALHLQPRDRARLEQLADRLWQERMIEPAPWLDWAAQHRFYVEVENPGWSRLLRRCNHLWILRGRLIDADYAFAARFHLRRKWQVRLLRPIRLLLKRRRAAASLG